LIPLKKNNKWIGNREGKISRVERKRKKRGDGADRKAKDETKDLDSKVKQDLRGKF
jgi:hypothetical protein